MAQTEHLPIYKTAYDLCLYFEQVVRNFSRYHKYSLGQDLRDGARRVLKLIVRANARREKSSVLLQIREEVEELKVLVRLCHDLSHQRPRSSAARWSTPEPCSGAEAQGRLPRLRPGQTPGSLLRSRASYGGEQAGRATQSNNYWSATTNAGNPNNAWNVNFRLDFVGWNTFWNHRRPRGRTLASCEARVERFSRRQLRALWDGAAFCLDVERQPEALPALRATVASYSGHLRHGAAYRKWMSFWERRKWLAALFVREGGDPWLVRTRWPERGVGGPRFSIQYGRLVRHAGPAALVFCQVGRFVEFYGPQRAQAAHVLRLVRVRIARGGYGFSVGFSMSLRERYVARAVRAGYAVADVREVGRIEPGCAARAIVTVWLPRGGQEARVAEAHR